MKEQSRYFLLNIANKKFYLHFFFFFNVANMECAIVSGRKNGKTFSVSIFSVGIPLMTKKLTNNHTNSLCIKLMNIGIKIIHWIIKIMDLFFCYSFLISWNCLRPVMKFIPLSNVVEKLHDLSML